MIMAMAVLSVVLFSCVREEMTCDKELIVVQRIVNGNGIAFISGNTVLYPNGTFGSPAANFYTTLKAVMMLAVKN